MRWVGDFPPGEAGELLVRGANVTRGYLRRPAETEFAFTPDGWLSLSGDIARVDADGISGRWIARRTCLFQARREMSIPPRSKPHCPAIPTSRNARSSPCLMKDGVKSVTSPASPRPGQRHHCFRGRRLSAGAARALQNASIRQCAPSASAQRHGQSDEGTIARNLDGAGESVSLSAGLDEPLDDCGHVHEFTVIHPLKPSTCSGFDAETRPPSPIGGRRRRANAPARLAIRSYARVLQQQACRPRCWRSGCGSSGAGA